MASGDRFWPILSFNNPNLHRLGTFIIAGIISWASVKLLMSQWPGVNDEEDESEKLPEKSGPGYPDVETLARIPPAVMKTVTQRLGARDKNGEAVCNSIWSERIVVVTNEYIARFIGRRGRNIALLREKRLIQIKIVKIDSETNYVYIFGRKEHVDEAVRLMTKQLLRFRLECHCRLGVPQQYISAIIGRQGSVINEIREDTSARIEIPKKRPQQRLQRTDSFSRRQLPLSSLPLNDESADLTEMVEDDAATPKDDDSDLIQGYDQIVAASVDGDDGDLCLVFLSGLPHHVAHAKLKIVQIIGRVYRGRKRRRDASKGLATHTIYEADDRERWEDRAMKPSGLRFGGILDDDDDNAAVEYSKSYRPIEPTLAVATADVNGVSNGIEPSAPEKQLQVAAAPKDVVKERSPFEDDEVPTFVAKYPPVKELHHRTRLNDMFSAASVDGNVDDGFDDSDVDEDVEVAKEKPNGSGDRAVAASEPSFFFRQRLNITSTDTLSDAVFNAVMPVVSASSILPSCDDRLKDAADLSDTHACENVVAAEETLEEEEAKFILANNDDLAGNENYAVEAVPADQSVMFIAESSNARPQGDVSSEGKSGESGSAASIDDSINLNVAPGRSRLESDVGNGEGYRVDLPRTMVIFKSKDDIALSGTNIVADETSADNNNDSIIVEDYYGDDEDNYTM